MEKELIEEIKNQIRKLEAERLKLIGQRKIIANPPTATTIGNVNHINAIKEKLNKPENIELLNDEDINYNGQIVTIPNTRVKIYNNYLEKINNPLNIYYYAYTLKLAKSDINKCFEPNFTRVYDFFDNTNIVGKVFINFEAPDLRNINNDKFYSSSECEEFEQNNFILLEDNPSKNIKALKVDPLSVRNSYMDKLIDGSIEDAINELKKYFIIYKGSSRTRKQDNM